MTIDDGLSLHISCNIAGNKPQSDLRTESGSSVNPKLQVWTPNAKVAILRFQCSKRSDAGVHPK